MIKLLGETSSKEQGSRVKGEEKVEIVLLHPSPLTLHPKKELLLFCKKCWKKKQNNSHKEQSSDNIESFQRSNINSHLFSPFAITMLRTKKIIVNIQPENSKIKSNLFCIENKGRTIDAKNTNDKLAENSDNLFSWESFSDRFIGNDDDTMDKLVKSREGLRGKGKGLGEAETALLYPSPFTLYRKELNNV